MSFQIINEIDIRKPHTVIAYMHYNKYNLSRTLR
jgi:hypothetical protein